jgi:hypothetical protein
MNQKPMKSNYFAIIASCLYLFSTSLNAQTSETKVIRDLITPRHNIFYPDSVPNLWVEPLTEKSREMPLPGGIKASTAKKVNDERTEFLKSKNIKKRSVHGSETANPVSLNPEIQKNINGFLGTGTPNDNHIAVANNGQIISVMNTTIRVHNDTGKVIKSWSLQFYPNTNNKVDNLPTLDRIYDPRVVYDPYEDRFIVLYMHGTTDKTSFIVVGFSSAGDPLKPWNVYMVTGNPVGDSVWSDYPIVSQTKEDFFFTVNLLGNGASWEEGFRESLIWQLRKSDGYEGKPLRKNVYTNIKHNGIIVRNICPAQNGPMPNGTDNYFVSVKSVSEKNDTVYIHKITNTQASGMASHELLALKTNQFYGFPPNALQPDTGFKFRLRTNDTRVLTAIRDGDHIQFMQNSMNFETKQAHLMHSHVYINKPNFVSSFSWDADIRSHLITHDSLEFGYPAMAFVSDRNGDPSTITTAVYTSQYHMPGMGVIYQNRYGEYSDFLKIKEGQTRIAYFGIDPDMQRWGDYEGIQWKFNEPGVFYTVGSYGRNNAMSSFISRIKIADSVWKQPIASVRIFPVPSNNGIVNIEWKGQLNETMQGVLTKLSGASSTNDHGQHSFIFTPVTGTNIYRLHTHNLSPGVYVLNLYKNTPIDNLERLKHPKKEAIHTQKIIIE